MISAEQYDKFLSDRARGKSAYLEKKREKFYKVFKSCTDMWFRQGRTDELMLGWDDEVHCSNNDEFDYCVVPAANKIVEELKNLGYYVSVKKLYFSYVIYLKIRTKPNLWERIWKK